MNSLLCIGGVAFSPQMEAKHSFGPLASSSFVDFQVHPLAGSEFTLNPLRFGSLDKAVLRLDGIRRVWDAWSGTAVFRDGSNLVIATFRDGQAETEIEWLTKYGTESERCEVHATPQNGPDGQICFPGLDQYPHLCFLLPWLLAKRQGIWIHASGALRNGKMYILTGRSGRGKSTISKLIHASGQFEISSDEKNILRKHNGTFFAFGSPWTSNARLSANIAAPLGGIFFLDHAKENLIQPIAAGTALKKLLPQLHLPWFDEPMTHHILRTAENLVETIPCWSLAFRPDKEVVERLVDFTDAL